MNCNMIRNSTKSDISSTNTSDNFKSFPDKNFNRFKNRSPMENNNSQYKQYKYKFKKFYKRPDDSTPNDHEPPRTNHHNNVVDEPRPGSFKYANGDVNDDHGNHRPYGRMERNSPEKSYDANRRKFQASSAYTGDYDCNGRHARDGGDYRPANRSSQDEFGANTRPDRRFRPKWVNRKYSEPNLPPSTINHVAPPTRLTRHASEKYSLPKNSVAATDKSGARAKFNFLQESQLNQDEDSTIVTKSTVQLSNGALNPSAIEFTPSGAAATSACDTDSLITDGVRKLALVSNDCSQQPVATTTNIAISNPIVLDEGLIMSGATFHSHFSPPPPSQGPFIDAALAKLAVTGECHQQQPTMFHAFPSGLAGRPINHYPPTAATATAILPQFHSLALYGGTAAGGTGPPIPAIRYHGNHHQHPPPTGYLLYSPALMINGPTAGPGAAIINRPLCYPIGPSDIPTATAPFPSCHPHQQHHHHMPPFTQPAYFSPAMPPLPPTTVSDMSTSIAANPAASGTHHPHHHGNTNNSSHIR